MTPYYDQDGITLYHGDCLEVMDSLREPVNLAITSPPYNLGERAEGSSGMRWVGGKSKWGKPQLNDGYGDHGDAMPYPEYVAWQQEVLRRCWSHLADDGAIFYNHKPRVFNKELRTPLALNPGLPLRQIVIWKRAGGQNFSPTHYAPSHEWVMILAKTAWGLRDRAASGLMDVWEIPNDPPSKHPAPFPLGLPLRILETVTAQTILDPFVGKGTTLMAAKMMGRRAIGIDNNESYCEMAATLLSQGVLLMEAS